MVSWDADILRSIVIGAAIGAGMLLGTLGGSARVGEEDRLRPTAFSFIVLSISVFLFVFFFYLLINEERQDEVLWLYILIIANTVGGAWFYWFMYMRIIYWSDDGVGIRGTFVKPRFIQWTDVAWAGTVWSGDLQIRSRDKKITFSRYNGGHTDLILATKQRAPASHVQFA